MIHYEKDNKILIRFIAFSSRPTEGFYRYKDILQISQIDPEAPQLEQLMGHHPLIVEYMFCRPDIDEVRKTTEDGLGEGSDRLSDNMVLRDYCFKIRDEVVALLSLIVDPWIDVVRNDSVWVYYKESKTRYAQTGYIWDINQYGDDFIETGLSPIELMDTNKYFNRIAPTVSEKRNLPDIIDKLMDSYHSLSEEEKDVFRRSTALFHQSIHTKGRSGSLMFVGMISAIENLISYEHKDTVSERCECCGQLKYQIRQKFLDFMSKYASNAPEYKKVADEMYKTRSGIGHGGELLSSDLIGQVVSAHESSKSFFGSMNVVINTRIALINWCIQKYHTKG